MKKTLGLVWLPFLIWLGAAAPAAAEQYIVDGANGCVAIGGEWHESGQTCVVPRLIVGIDDTVTVSAGINLGVEGPLFIYGRLETQGQFWPNGHVYNRGTLITAGLTVNGHVIENSGTFINRSWLHTHGGIANYGTFENAGRAYLETCSGPIFNYGYFHNEADVENWGTLIVNHAYVVNDGRVYNPDAEFYQIQNFGAFENRVVVENEGLFTNACGGVSYGTGTFSGVPVQYQPCDAASAIQMLTARVYEMSAVLSKKDVRTLTGHLGSATKLLTLLGDRAGAAAEVELFMQESGALTSSGALPGYVGSAFSAWAERVLTLLAS